MERRGEERRHSAQLSFLSPNANLVFCEKRGEEGREVETQINKMTNSETNLNLLRPPPYIGPNLFYQHCGRRKNYRQYFSISFPYLHFSQHLQYFYVLISQERRLKQKICWKIPLTRSVGLRYKSGPPGSPVVEIQK